MAAMRILLLVFLSFHLLAGAATGDVATNSPGVLVTNLVEVLPYVGNFARSLDLDLPDPLTTNHVTRFSRYRGIGTGVGLWIDNRWTFAFDVHQHFVDSFTDRNFSMTTLWRAEEIKPLIQPSKITKEQALEMARAWLERLGYLEKDMPLLPPTVHQWDWKPPGVSKGEPLPFFTVKWPWAKYPDWEYFTIEIDGFRKKATHFSTIYPRQDPPASDDK